MSLAGRTAVVTGASSGVGRAVALALARQGADIWAVARDPDRVAETARAAAAAGVSVESRVADLSVDAEVDGVGAAILAGVARLDLLVHSAGVHVAGGVAATSADALDAQYRVNLRAPFVLTRVLLPALAAARGTIVFVNSTAGLRGNGSASAYAATKGGLRALADSLRDEVNPLGVRVLSLFPGRMATPLQERLHAAEGAPFEPDRLLHPDDVAAMVLAAFTLPHRAEVTDITLRPTVK